MTLKLPPNPKVHTLSLQELTVSRETQPVVGKAITRQHINKKRHSGAFRKIQECSERRQTTSLTLAPNSSYQSLMSAGF